MSDTDAGDKQKSPGRSIGAFCERRPFGIRIGVQDTPVDEPGFRASNVLPEDDAELFVSRLIDELGLWGKYSVPGADDGSRVVVEDDQLTEEEAEEVAEHIRDATDLRDEVVHVE